MDAWLDECAQEEPDDPADERSGEPNHEDFAPESAASVAERENPFGDEEEFERGSDDGCERARNDAYEDVVSSPPHYVWLRDSARPFFLKTTVKSIAELERVAADLAVTLRPGDAIGLSGKLGAGKTTFVRALVRALHGDESAASPTFTFRHTYRGVPPIEHLDLQRIENPAEAVELGLDDAFCSDSIVLVEWPERLPGLMPVDAIRVTIEGAGDAPRTFSIERPE